MPPPLARTSAAVAAATGGRPALFEAQPFAADQCPAAQPAAQCVQERYRPRQQWAGCRGLRAGSGRASAARLRVAGKWGVALLATPVADVVIQRAAALRAADAPRWRVVMKATDFDAVRRAPDRQLQRLAFCDLRVPAPTAPH